MYEELTIYAIQKPEHKGFDNRFSTYSSKAERDKTFIFLKQNQKPETTEKWTPVTLRIIVKTEEINQLEFNLEVKEV